MISFRPLGAIALSLCFSAMPLAAQLPPVTVPKGLLRVDIGGRFEWWDQRFRNGVREGVGADFTRNPADGSWLPLLATAEARLRQATGQTALNLSLGRTSSTILVTGGTGYIGAGYGLTSRITLFGTVPIVRVRVQHVFGNDTLSATAGLNPADPVVGNATAQAQTGAFKTEFTAALTSLGLRIAAGDYNSDSEIKALAEQTFADGIALKNSLDDLLGSTFLPVTGSAGQSAIAAKLETLRVAISTLVPTGPENPFGTPAFPSRGPIGAELESFATSTAGPIAAEPFQPPILSYLGDVEVGAAFTWLDRRAATGGFGIRSALVGTVRLPTGQLDLPEDLFDQGTGDHQPDVQGDLVTDLFRGRFGARLTARYVLQLPGPVDRRLSPYDQPFAPAASLAGLTRDPGEILEGAFEPFFRIAPTLAITAGVRHWSKGADKYSYAPGQIPIDGTTPGVLAADSEESATAFAAGISFSHTGTRKDGTAGMPMDAWLRFESVTSSTMGRIPARRGVTAILRLYRRLF
ncbi:MAG: hypothetical protein HOP28_01860 [Gemmatimonadales bacterium]|nr:hypothetical protein [Gemmatimonadales bacterium]